MFKCYTEIWIFGKKRANQKSNKSNKGQTLSTIHLLLSITLNGLQVNGGVFDREFTKSLIIRDFDDVLKNPFGYVQIFLLHTSL